MTIHLKKPARDIAFALTLSAALCAQGHAETLRAAAAAVPPTLGNPYSASGLPATELWTAIFDTLVRLDWLGGPQPGLALSWSNPDSLTWVFKLRPGVVFHNGRPVTASAIVKVIDYLRSPEAVSFLVSREVNNVAGANALDDLTLELKLSQPDAIFPKRISLVMIVDAEAWAEKGADAFALNPIGSGPYRLVNWGNGNVSPELAAFAQSWRAPQAFDRLLFRAVPEKSSRVQSLLSGQLDVISGLGFDDIAEIESAGFLAQRQKTTQVNSIALPNVRDGKHPLKDVRVRQALNYAVDKQAIATTILGGDVNIASQGAVPGIPGYNASLKPYPYDPARARALLAEAGYPNGFALAIEIMVMFMPLDAVMYQRVAQDLRAVGVEATVRSIPYADFIRKYTTNQWGNVDAFAMGWNNSSYQDSARALEYFSCLRTNPFFCDIDTAALLKTAIETPDQGARELKLQDVAARLYELAPAIWLVNATYVNAARPDITNFRMRPTGIPFEELGVKKN